jgi:hypothetical protein
MRDIVAVVHDSGRTRRCVPLVGYRVQHTSQPSSSPTISVAIRSNESKPEVGADGGSILQPASTAGVHARVVFR